MAFATAQELEAYTKGLIPASDPRATVILEGATKALTNYAGWNIAPPDDFTLLLDGGSEVLYLPTLKLNSVASVKVSGVLLDPSTYEWSRITGNLRKRNGCEFPEVWGGIEVAYNSGYATVPEDLKQIVLQVSSLALSSPTGATREQAGQVAMSWATTAPGVSGGLALLDRDYAILSAYLLPKDA